MDIGGTFTDVVAYDEQAGTYAAGKASTTPDDLTEGVFEALAQVVADVSEIGFFVHGTTVGLNAFLQRRGERVLLLATRGVGDAYQIARGNRTKLYELHYRKPAPLVTPAGHNRDQQAVSTGKATELEPLDDRPGTCRRPPRPRRRLRRRCRLLSLLHLNPAHELRAEAILREEIADLPISLSHRIARRVARVRAHIPPPSSTHYPGAAPSRAYLERLEEQLGRARPRGAAACDAVERRRGYRSLGP